MSLKLQFLGQSGFLLKGSETTLVIDPFFTDNPKAPFPLSDLTDVDWVLATHDHHDHWPDVIPLAKATGAGVVAQVELALAAGEAGVSKVEPMNIGGAVQVGDTIVHCVYAQHTAHLGDPTGFVIEMEGQTVYHAGDTGLFGDMALIGALYAPTIALVPCGNRFTMGADHAAEAVRMVGAPIAIPMHYGTFDIIEDNADAFVEAVGPQITVHTPAPGEWVTF
ncbi:metal-dependent hydrolase [bacterium]|nr:metal-dependent hydrolase [bacterium]